MIRPTILFTGFLLYESPKCMAVLLDLPQQCQHFPTNPPLFHQMERQFNKHSVIHFLVSM